TPPPAPVGGAKLAGVAIVLALVAVVLNSLYIDNVKKEVEGKSFTVFRLTRSVQRGDHLSDRDVRAQRVPLTFKDSFVGALDETAVRVRIEERETIEQPAPQGNLVTADLFTAPEQSGMDRRITKGKRLVSLPVNPKSVPGSLRPGMFVDIEAPFAAGG